MTCRYAAGLAGSGASPGQAEGAGGGAHRGEAQPAPICAPQPPLPPDPGPAEIGPAPPRPGKHRLRAKQRGASPAAELLPPLNGLKPPALAC